MRSPRGRSSPSSTPLAPSNQTTTTSIGRAAEQRVADALRARGCRIVGCNVRVGRDELDVVAIEGETHVIVEVRVRTNTSRGNAFESIGPRKQARLRRAAERYFAVHGAKAIRIDVAAVNGEEIEFIENAIDFTST